MIPDIEYPSLICEVADDSPNVGWGRVSECQADIDERHRCSRLSRIGSGALAPGEPTEVDETMRLSLGGSWRPTETPAGSDWRNADLVVTHHIVG